MAYTRAWDETFPADTQLANLLGEDVRNTKADIRERVSSFGAGTLANRPTPEAVFVGVIYIATDNFNVYRWNGASWDVIGIIPTFSGSTAQLVRGDGSLSNALTGDFSAVNLNASANVNAAAVVADNIVLTNGGGQTLTRGGELGNAVISGNNVNITFQSNGTNLDLYVNGAFVKHVALF